MIEHYLVHDYFGPGSAKREAEYLRDVMGYKIISIEHRKVPTAKNVFSSYSSDWVKSEFWYYITVDTDGYVGEKTPIPEIVEC